jgi:hypothetical protein
LAAGGSWNGPGAIDALRGRSVSEAGQRTPSALDLQPYDISPYDLVNRWDRQRGALRRLLQGARVDGLPFGVGADALGAERVDAGDDRRDEGDVGRAAAGGIEGADGSVSEIDAELAELVQQRLVAGGRRQGGIAVGELEGGVGPGQAAGDDVGLAG